ncbi:hypothetical protein Z517_00060 [Fonsecaea pedrosoi CBS 271.37]|uniref:DUF6590 domain-containing protein n=1 Tax=Fonsecaea pedrosoi CBS 271.37 TaxID=1442368 RepID=A0A0D2FDH0_9EURO|nr:uncharacterized protein Z517_00060 [Fonsecaea pedrosoi CBS 271.37]KIW84672.1 hypothetical protein Z517_00060 [Fonsecaea pedrosoi CBS 271.37]
MPNQPKPKPTQGDRQSEGRAASKALPLLIGVLRLTWKGRNNGGPGNNRQSPAQRRSDAPRSTPQIGHQPAQARPPVSSPHQSPSIATNPIFPQESSRSFQLATREQANPRVSLPSTPGPSSFNSSLDLSLQGLADIPSGDYQKVATYIRANLLILKQDPEALLREAIQAYRFASSRPELQHSGRLLYGDGCIQQYVILRQLQRLQRKPVEALQPNRVTTEEVTEAVKHYFDQLLDKKSLTRKQFDEGLGEARARAMKQLQGAGPSLQRTTTSTQQSPTQIRTSTTAIQAQQSSLPFRTSRAPSLPSLAPLTPHGEGTDRSHPSQPGSTTQIPRSEKAYGLDPRYVTRNSGFYQLGRVFAILWHEPFNDSQGYAGHSSRQSCMNENVSIGIYGEPIYSSIRRMVVVRQDHGCSVCIQISTYGKRGLAKFKTSSKDVDAHSIIYMDDTEPRQHPGEPASNKRPIAVMKATADQKLNSSSRLCYSQPHTVQHTVKAMDVGLVTQESLPYLLSYYQTINTLP